MNKGGVDSGKILRYAEGICFLFVRCSFFDPFEMIGKGLSVLFDHGVIALQPFLRDLLRRNFNLTVQ